MPILFSSVIKTRADVSPCCTCRTPVCTKVPKEAAAVLQYVCQHIAALHALSHVSSCCTCGTPVRTLKSQKKQRQCCNSRSTAVRQHIAALHASSHVLDLAIACHLLPNGGSQEMRYRWGAWDSEAGLLRARAVTVVVVSRMSPNLSVHSPF